MTVLQRVTAVPSLAPREAGGYKNQYGFVLVVGGSRGMSGAVALATGAALRGGAGLVTFATPEPIAPIVAAACPCAMWIPLACDQRGELTPESVRQMLRGTAYTVLAVGPGMGRGGPQQNLVRAAIEQDRPLVLDADGLNNLADIADWPALVRCPMILTPHPGELGRLIGKSTGEIQADRENTAIAAVSAWQKQNATGQPLVLVLKGAGTIVTDGRRVYVNDTGNPGMATGGAGDVLTGLTAALLGQHLPPFEAAVLAVHTHGRSGDLAAEQLGQPSLIATDLIDFLPAAMSGGHPALGMWKDRQDMADVSEYVRRMRKNPRP